MCTRPMMHLVFITSLCFAAIAAAGSADVKSSFRHLLFIGNYGTCVQFDANFKLEQGPQKLNLSLWGRAGIVTSTISPDRSRVFLGHQGKDSPLAVLNSSSLELLDLPQLKYPELRKPYWAYEPTYLVAVSNSRVYVADESFWVQEPRFDSVLVDLDRVTIERKENRRKEYDSYYHQSRCDISPDGKFMFYADAYQIQFIDLESDALLWVIDHGKERHEILSRKIDWQAKVMDLIWSLHRGSETTYEQVLIDLASQKTTVSSVGEPWVVAQNGKDTFLAAFLNAYSECGQGRAQGELPVIDDKLRAIKDKLTPEAIKLFPHAPAQVYVSPEGEYVLANDHPYFDYEKFSDGWVLIDIIRGRVVENALAEGLKDFREQLVGVYFTN